jgi:hypothetical protein
MIKLPANLEGKLLQQNQGYAETQDHVTWRRETAEFIGEESQSIFQAVVHALNEKFPSQDPWVFCEHDGGYEEGRSQSARFFGNHVLKNSDPSKGQNPHVDGMGYPLMRFPDTLGEWVHPLSIALMLRRGPNTRFGETYCLANRFCDSWLGMIENETLLAEFNAALDRSEQKWNHETDEMVEAGTANIFPMGCMIHAGPPACSSGDQRFVLYMTACRRSWLERFKIDRMFTAEYAPGFAGRFKAQDISHHKKHYVHSVRRMLDLRGGGLCYLVFFSPPFFFSEIDRCFVCCFGNE